MSFDHLGVAGLIPLAIWILLSGLDDLFISLVFCLTRPRSRILPAEAELAGAAERRIAIFVPLWQEHRVIEKMLERNLSVIRYQDFDIFVGVYPNDEATVRAVSQVARLHPRVHLAYCGRPGPTSKGDCLNWIFKGMRTFEEETGERFEIVTTHDAEDLIHPDSLRLINWFSRRYDMVQVPVLPLPTPFRQFTHGIYCDEFAEFQTKDIPVRQRLGGFLPSNGVGTGYSRAALERLAVQRQGRIFAPECLTEDYENGYCLHALGCRQIFVPVHFEGGEPRATREYFPRTLRSAIRQRSRWVAGIVLQGWERQGWRGPRGQTYWFCRDRKGLVGNLLAPLANLLFFGGMVHYGLVRRGFAQWHPGYDLPPWLALFCAATLWLAMTQVGLRTWCCARIYGWPFACGVPLRMLWANVLNSAATAGAIGQYWKARRNRRTLEWLKTDHVYPAQMAPQTSRPRLGEILVKMRCVSMEELEEALANRAPGVRIGEHLIISQRITEENLYQALSSQAGIPLGMPELGEVNPLVTRLLPVALARRANVIPYRVSGGELHLVTPEVPSRRIAEELAAASGMGVRFRLVRPPEFLALAQLYLPGGPLPE